MTHSNASILARLKNKAKTDGIAFQQLLNLIFQEEFIRRLAQSQYREKLILKGGFLLYSISDFTTRPTVDADYLLRNHSNELTRNDAMINRWAIFCKKVLKYELNLDEVIHLIISFLDPPFQAIMIEKEFTKYWHSNHRQYRIAHLITHTEPTNAGS